MFTRAIRYHAAEPIPSAYILPSTRCKGHYYDLVVKSKRADVVPDEVRGVDSGSVSPHTGLGVIGLFLHCVLMAGLSTGQGPGPAHDPGDPPVRLVYATSITQRHIFEAGEGFVLQRFMHENPGVEVVVRQIPFSEYDTQILLSVRGGSAPDAGRVNHSSVRSWAGAGYLMVLDDLVARSGVITPADYYQGFWQVCFVGGRQYALPLTTDCRVLFCNLNLFQKAGCGIPRTWTELVDAAARIHRPAERVYGIAMPADTEWGAAYDVVGNFLVANNGELLSPDGLRAVASSDPAAREAFRFACDLVTRHRVCPPGMAGLNGTVIEALFVQNRLGMMMSGPWARANFEALQPGFSWGKDYALATIPAGPSGGQSGSAQGGWLVAGFSASRHPDAVRRLLEYLSRPESLARIAAVECLPPRRAAAAMESFNDPFYAVFLDQLATARPPLALVPQLPNVARMVQRAYQRVVAGSAGTEEALIWLDRRLNENILR